MQSIINQYKESYVAFLDVLGFKNMVTKNDDEKLSTYFREVNKTIKELQGIDIKKDIGYIVISDSVILTIEKSNSPDKNLEILRQICIAVSKIQKKLALKNIWIRGAISSGKAYFNQENNQIVGPAYIDAYLLEEEHAVFPRVILDNRIISDLAFDCTDDFIKAINTSDVGREDYVAIYDWNKNEFATNRTIEQDVLFFIDYLETIVSNEDEFKVIHQNVKENLYTHNIITKKFRWVINYIYTLLLRKEYKNKPEVIKRRELLKKI